MVTKVLRSGYNSEPVRGHGLYTEEGRGWHFFVLQSGFIFARIIWGYETGQNWAPDGITNRPCFVLA